MNPLMIFTKYRHDNTPMRSFTKYRCCLWYVFGGSYLQLTRVCVQETCSRGVVFLFKLQPTAQKNTKTSSPLHQHSNWSRTECPSSNLGVSVVAPWASLDSLEGPWGAHRAPLNLPQVAVGGPLGLPPPSSQQPPTAPTPTPLQQPTTAKLLTNTCSFTIVYKISIVVLLLVGIKHARGDCIGTQPHMFFTRNVRTTCTSLPRACIQQATLPIELHVQGMHAS